MTQVNATTTTATTNARHVPPPVMQLPRPTVFDDASYTPFDPSFDVDGAAARAVTAYDRDNDGAIDLNSGAGIVDRLFDETSRFGPDGAKSIAKLAHEADRNGNGDGKATVEEIARIMRRFDRMEFLGGHGRIAFPDGRLAGSERRAFLDAYGEVDATYHKPWHPPTPPTPTPMPDFGELYRDRVPYPYERIVTNADDILRDPSTELGVA